MSEEHELKAKIQLGEHAERILNDKLVKEALSSMRETVFHNIRTSNFKQIEERENLYKMLKAIDGFEEEFKRQIQGGTKARSRLQELLNKIKR